MDNHMALAGMGIGHEQGLLLATDNGYDCMYKIILWVWIQLCITYVHCVRFFFR